MFVWFWLQILTLVSPAHGTWLNISQPDLELAQSWNLTGPSLCQVRLFPHVILICQPPTGEGIPVLHLQSNFWGHRESLLIPLHFFLCFSPVRIGTLFPVWKWCWRITKMCLWQLCLAAITRVCFIHNRRKRSSESQEISSGNYSEWRTGSQSQGLHCSCSTLDEHWEPVLNQQRAWEELSRLTVLTCLSCSPQSSCPEHSQTLLAWQGREVHGHSKGLWVMGNQRGTSTAFVLHPQLRGCSATLAQHKLKTFYQAGQGSQLSSTSPELFLDWGWGVHSVLQMPH